MYFLFLPCPGAVAVLSSTKAFLLSRRWTPSKLAKERDTSQQWNKWELLWKEFTWYKIIKTKRIIGLSRSDMAAISEEMAFGLRREGCQGKMSYRQTEQQIQSHLSDREAGTRPSQCGHCVALQEPGLLWNRHLCCWWQGNWCSAKGGSNGCFFIQGHLLAAPTLGVQVKLGDPTSSWSTLIKVSASQLWSLFPLTHLRPPPFIHCPQLISCIFLVLNIVFASFPLPISMLPWEPGTDWPFSWTCLSAPSQTKHHCPLRFHPGWNPPETSSFNDPGTQSPIPSWHLMVHDLRPIIWRGWGFYSAARVFEISIIR